jgi:hypothetical protein
MRDVADFRLVEEIVRDGSYASEFQFELPQLQELLEILDSLSFVDMIDIGPGTGLGTRNPAPDPTSEEHLRLAAEMVDHTELTALVLPSIAGEAELELLERYADTLDLVRVSVDADDVSAATELLAACEERGIATSLNLLKTYLISPAEAVEAAETAVDHGAEIIYVADSAGGFRPDDVTSYVSQLQGQVDIEVGFHGHDNLGWGLQNAVAAVEAGATYVDASFQGIGRSAQVHHSIPEPAHEASVPEPVTQHQQEQRVSTVSRSRAARSPQRPLCTAAVTQHVHEHVLSGLQVVPISERPVVTH